MFSDERPRIDSQLPISGYIGRSLRSIITSLVDKTRARFLNTLPTSTYLSDAVIIIRLASFVVTQARPIIDGGR